MRWPEPIGSPVLDSLRPVIEHSRDVQTRVDKITEVAGWMAYEALPVPEYALPFGIGAHDVNVAIDFIMTSDTIDTAFTDFFTHVKFQTDYAGQHWSDSDAEFACLKRAMDNGIPVLDGKWMASVTRAELNTIFAGNIEMPMLDEKLAVLHQVGPVLVAKYNGRFSNFIHACSPKLYDHGNGMVDRLVTEFPRFNDVSQYDGHEIKVLQTAAVGHLDAVREFAQALWLSDRRSPGNDGVRGLHRAGGAAPARNHQLFADARALDQFLPIDSAR